VSATVLVTGAGGFVGSAIVRRIVERGAAFSDGARVEHVVALLRPGGTQERLDELPDDGSWSRVDANVYDPGALGAVLDEVRPRVVVNVALDKAVHERDDVPLDPLHTLFDGLRGTVGPRFVHVGSAWVLASGTELGEDAALDPGTPYARHKAAQDALLPRLGEETGVPWLNLRLFNVFGRFEAPTRLLPHLVARLSRSEHADLTRGEQLRDFNDVDDVAEAFRLALRAPDEGCGSIYHIGSGRATSVRELVDLVTQRLGGAELVRFGTGQADDDRLPALVADPALARRFLGWKPGAPLPERVHAAVEWWLDRIDAERRQPEESLR
jgi:dolichol-phosphate mannosyltransferase